MTEGTAQEPTTLAWYVQAVGEDEAFAQQCTTEAEAMVDALISEQYATAIPAGVRSRAVLEVGADLYYRKASRNGYATFGSPAIDEAPAAVRISRDPLSAAYPFLRPFIPFGLA